MENYAKYRFYCNIWFSRYLPLNYYDSTTYGTQEVTLTFHEEILTPLHFTKVLSVVVVLLLILPIMNLKLIHYLMQNLLDKDIDCGPFSVSNNNISLSKNDYYATFVGVFYFNKWM